ncbi:MAG: orotidine-5'-phosphate decarboxylase, partial [Acidimicrobiia bacterium]|nr:orotidine-5'-phosphate decarboxylase [Acidimicrobiia bacterium]
MTFHAQLARSWAASGSMLCVGLDPDPARMPGPLAGERDSTERFCREIIDATAEFACAFKPQIAYFASQGEEAALERICTHVREQHPDATLILDAKRGDIGSSAELYAQAALTPQAPFGCDALTVSPYLGEDSLAPFFAACAAHQRG